MKIKIGFNIKPLLNNHQSRGIGNYTYNLLEELKKNADISLIEFTDESELSGVDLVHYPFFDLFKHTLPIRSKYGRVVTIHDVIPLVFPQHYPPGLKGKLGSFWQKMALKNVSSVITDSNSSALDISRFLLFNRKRIYPVALAASDEFRIVSNFKKLDQVREKFSLPTTFALYVGNVNWNKNLLNTTQACINIGVDIVLAGGGFEQIGNLNHPELKNYKEFMNIFGDNRSVHILGYVTNNELVCLMNLARVLLLVSFYEGFGLPILEAMACGCPVITSSISSMPEVGGEAALYVDPIKVEDISDKLKAILNDKKIRLSMIHKGKKWAERFTWKKTSDETIEVYKQSLK